MIIPAGKGRMKKILERLWPLVGFMAVVGSFYLLYYELKGESVRADVWADLKAIPLSAYIAAGVSTLVAYAALAWYDHIALLHLGVRHISWIYISICSFTTYALSHNVGASVLSGAMVRYRAYSTKGADDGAGGRARHLLRPHLRPWQYLSRRPTAHDPSRHDAAPVWNAARHHH
jgi:uncharacterized membrane protein YbhN (UPF0104 family)